MGILESLTERLERIETQLQTLLSQRERPSDAGFVTIPEAMKLLGVSRSTIYEFLDSGQLTRRKIGKSVRIERAEINAVVRGEKSIDL
jgi:excisionase family DNA binding protein